jgi:phage terminase Nu1 subunit (DNA packaging protein)
VSKAPATVSAAALAGLLGVHRNSIGNWIKEGLPTEKRKGRRALEIPLGPALQWIRERERAAWEAKLEAATSTPDIDRERYRKLQAEADMAEMDRDRQRGELVSQVEAERVWSTHVLQVRARLLSLPAHARVRGVAADAVAVVDELIRKALESLARAEPAADEAEEGA